MKVWLASEQDGLTLAVMETESVEPGTWLIFRQLIIDLAGGIHAGTAFAGDRSWRIDHSAVAQRHPAGTVEELHIIAVKVIDDQPGGGGGNGIALQGGHPGRKKSFVNKFDVRPGRGIGLAAVQAMRQNPGEGS